MISSGAVTTATALLVTTATALLERTKKLIHPNPIEKLVGTELRTLLLFYGIPSKEHGKNVAAI